MKLMLEGIIEKESNDYKNINEAMKEEIVTYINDIENGIIIGIIHEYMLKVSKKIVQ